MRESQYADHAVIKTHMTHTASENSPGIYTLRSDNQEKKRRKKKKEIHNQTSH